MGGTGRWHQHHLSTAVRFEASSLAFPFDISRTIEFAACGHKGSFMSNELSTISLAPAIILCAAARGLETKRFDEL